MMTLASDWHPPIESYEWWRDIGGGLLGVVAASIVGAVTLLVAWRSHRLARRVTDREERRIDRERDERYDARLVGMVEPAMSSLLRYIRAADEEFEGPGHFAEQATVTARLTLVDAVARGADRRVSGALIAQHLRLIRHRNPGVHLEVAAEWTGHLGSLVSRKHSVDVLVAMVESSIDRAETQRGLNGSKA